jgi:hypothetical protein
MLYTYIGKHFRMLIENLVQESDWLFIRSSLILLIMAANIGVAALVPPLMVVLPSCTNVTFTPKSATSGIAHQELFYVPLG